MYIYSEHDETPLMQSMRRYVESNVRLSAWNYLFPVSQRTVLERARTQPYLTMALAHSPNDARMRDAIGYIESVRRGRFVGRAFPTTSAFTEVLDTLYTSIGEQPRYSLYSSFTVPSAAFVHADDPQFRPRLRPAPVDELIEQMTPGHVFLARLSLSEIDRTAPLRRDLSLKKALRASDAKQGAWQLAALLDSKSTGANRLLQELSKRTGAAPEDIQKALILGTAQGTANAPETIVRTIAHEFAHANIQTPMRVAQSALVDLVEGKASFVDVVTRAALEGEFLHEAQADIFASAISLDPDLTVRSRYNMAAAQLVHRAARNAKQELKGWKYGDPFRMVVMDPDVVESERSPLARMLRSAVQRMAGGRPKLLDELELVRDDGTVNMKDVERAVNYIASMSGMAASMAQEEARNAPREVRQVLEHYGDRLWAIPYMIGKASPELRGKEIEVRPEGVFLEGEKLDLAEIGLPELELDSMTGRQQMHPAQLRRSLNALRLYRRARRALIAGKRLVLQAGMAATEVVQAWRREFGAI